LKILRGSDHSEDLGVDKMIIYNIELEEIKFALGGLVVE
jgi:hypothetical protein